MKSIKFVGLVLLAALTQSASAAVTQFDFLNGFSGANEVPPTASSGTGVINTLSYDDSVGSFGTLTLNISYSGLAGASTASHIHGLAGVGTNAGVLFALSHSAANSGIISGSWAVNSSANLTGLFGGQTYVNLHSTVFPGGELRGQLVAVPEPSAYALIGLGAAGLAALRVRRN